MRFTGDIPLINQESLFLEVRDEKCVHFRNILKSFVHYPYLDFALLLLI